MKKLYLISIMFVGFLCFAYANSYGEEMQQAYNYAFNNGITTMQSIDKAGMYSELNRISMAKMISNFSINILGLERDTSLNCSFLDVSNSIDAQYDYGVTKACQLGLMGIGDDGKTTDNFNPYDIVTRGQFATAFSRALNKAEGTSITNGDPYYRPHVNYLYNKGIINSLDTPAGSHEKRGYVMLMMQRASNGTINISNKEDTLEGTISCDTNESCLEYLNKLWEEKHELTCTNKEALGGEDIVYIIDGYVADMGAPYYMVSTNEIIYMWGKAYGDKQGIYYTNTGGNVVEQELSALSKVIKLGTPMTCIIGVSDKSIFHIPEDIKFVTQDERIEANNAIVAEEVSPGHYRVEIQL